MGDPRSRRIRASIAGAVLVTCASATVLLTLHRDATNRRVVREQFDAHVTRLADRLTVRMQIYEYGLRGVRGVVMAMGEDGFDRALFRAYHESRDLPREFPGAHGYGLVRRVPADQEAAFVAAARRDGMPDYAIHQIAPHDGARDAILYIEPVERNRAALGVDVASEPKRRAATAETIRSGRAVLTAPITLLQATGFPGRAFLLLLPIFRRGMPVATATEREAAIYGWAYSALAIDEVLADFELRDDAIAIHLEDITPEAPGGAFLSAAGFAAAGVGGLVTAVERPVFGRQWRISARARRRFLDELNVIPPLDFAAIGGAASLLLAALAYAWTLGAQRSRLVRSQQERLVIALSQQVGESTAALDTARRDLEVIMGALPSLIAYWDRDQVGRYANRAYHEFFGVPPGTMPGRSMRGVLGEDRYAPVLGHIEGALRGEPQQFERNLRAADGRVVHAQTHYVPDVRDGEIRGFCVLIHDVTELNESKLKLAAAVRNHQAMLGALHQLTLVSVTDRDGRIRDANDAFCRASGYAWQELAGQDHRIMSSGVHPPAFWAAMWTTIAGGKPWRGEICNRARDGSRYWMDCMIAPVYGEGGKIDRYVSIRTDITASKAAVDDLAHERERLDNILRANNAGTWEWNMATGEARVDERWAQLIGRTLDELRPVSIDTMVDHGHPDDLLQSMPLLARHATGELPHHSVELRMKHRDGHWVWTMVRGRITTWTADGRPEWMYGTQQDITPSKEAQRQLAESQAFLDRAGRVAGVGGWQLALDTDTLRWTSEVYRIYEVSPDYVPTREGNASFYSPEVRAHANRLVAEALASGQGWDLETPIITAQGRERWVRVIGEAEFADGKPVRLIGALQDITARREADEALRRARSVAEAASAAKSAFLANMSHEIRTPLNAVIGLSYLLEQSPLTAEQRSYLAKIQIAGRSLLGVVNDVLDLSKIEAGEMALEDAPIALHDLLREIVDLLAPQVEAKGLALRLDLAPDLPQAVHGDAIRLRQILTNLLSNAAKFTEQGYVELRATCIERDAAQATLRLSVLDTGIGISAEQQGRLFQPFSQADASTTRQFGGTGLGLSIVRRLAEMMGGEAGVHSTPGVGSEFWVTARVRIAAPIAAEPATGLAQVAVLVADDDPDQRSQLLAMARALGWRAEAVESGSRLVERVRERIAAGAAPDALLVDWRMPGTDGVAALAELADHVGRDLMPAVLVITAHDRDAVRRAPGAPLVDAVLAKPVTSSQLFDAVNASTARRGRSRKGASRQLPRAGMARLPRVRILVVDDSAINLEVARRILESEGAIVSECGNGEAAVERLRAGPSDFDVVLMDVQMPVMDGNEATRTVRNQLGLTALPIIALTAGALLAERQRSLDAGMDAFLSKPLDPQALIDTVRQHAQRARGAPIAAETREAAAAPAAAPWPRVTGIDEREVAIRCGGDAALFLRMLDHVVTEFADLAVPPDRRSPGLVARLHKLRGSAGTLGAKAVHRLATRAELVLKGDDAPGEPELPALLRELAAALSALIGHARPVLDAHRARPAPGPAAVASPAPPGGGAIGAAEAEALTAAVRMLGALLAQQDLAAIDRARELGPALRAAWGETDARALGDAIERLEFARAQALVAARIAPASGPAG